MEKYKFKFLISGYNTKEMVDIKEFVLKSFDAVVLTIPEIETTSSSTTTTTQAPISTETSTSDPTTESTTQAASNVCVSFVFIFLSVMIKFFL